MIGLKWKRFFLLTLLLCMITGFTIGEVGQTRDITDMTGRTITVPVEIHSLLGTSPPVTVATYMMAPDLLMGVNSYFNQTKYIPKKYAVLPYVGGQQNTGVLNYETYIAMNPDVVLYFYPGKDDKETADMMQTHLNPIPVIAIKNAANAKDFTSEINYLGDVLNRKEQATELSNFYEEISDKVSSNVATIPDEKKVRTYYAEGKDGLQTDPANSFHSQLINICGGNNVATGEQTGVSGQTKVSMEDVVGWNPEVIIASDKQFYNSFYSNPAWKDIKAVQDKRVFLTPSEPFNWFDRPPGVNTIIGIPWTAKVLYPDLFKDIDLNSLTKEFYSKFYHYDLSENEVGDLLKGSGLSV